jgi:hypothetical protein
VYRVRTNINIEQIPKDEFPTRKSKIKLDYCTSYEWNSSWENFTDKGTLVFPKNLFYKDANNALSTLNGTKVNIGGFSGEPLIMRGDKISLASGYQYRKEALTKDVVEMATIFEGYVSKVYSSIPIKLDIEDNMWLLKQTAMPNKTFTTKDNVEDILKYIINTVNAKHKVKFTYYDDAKTNIGNIIVGNETAAQLLNRIGKLYGLRAYFRGTELRCGVFINIEKESQTQTFILNGTKANVLAEGQELEYRRKDDVVLSAIAHNTIEEEVKGKKNKDGSSKSKHKRLEVLVTLKNGEWEYNEITQGEQVPENNEGERRTFFFAGAKTIAELKEAAKKELLKYYYTGLNGSFKSLAIPYIRHNDKAKIINPKLPEQNGTYRVKAVNYEGGVNGLSQTIYLDYKIDG